MAQEVVIKLTDDIDGDDANETISFSLDGRSYQIDLNNKNAIAMRKALKPYIDAGRTSRESTTRGRRAGTTPTQFSLLDSEEKERFRAWANLPDARRIGDARVKEWLEAGRP